MPPLITHSHASPLRQSITGDTSILPLIQPKNPSQQDAEELQPPPGSSSLLPSRLQHQAQSLQANHKNIQQFHQHLKAEQLDRETFHIFVLQLQNDFALPRYLLFSSVGTIPISDTSVENSAISPPINPDPNPNPTPTPLSLLIPALLGLQFVFIPRRALWDHPERNQTTLQTSIFSLQPTHGMAP